MDKHDLDLLVKALEALEDIAKNPDKVEGEYCPSCLVGSMVWTKKEGHKDGGHWMCTHCGKRFSKGFTYESVLHRR